MSAIAPPSVSSYTIALVTALPKELAAVLLMLDAEYEDPEDLVQHDKNTYAWGRMGRHNVVLVSLPAGVYGKVSAATTVSGITATLPHIKIGLMIGIGAGLPNEKHTVLLGDIVVSQPQGESGGVIQYDLGMRKNVDGEEVFERVGQLNSPPTVLLNALSQLQARHDIGRRQLDALLTVFDQNDFAKKYRRPDSSSYHPGLSHKSPVVHYGIIASGDGLIKSTTARADIVKGLGLPQPICIEMEAAGIMNNFPCLVIRGICDFADEDKNDDWQCHAAGIAAAYAKELLTWVSPQQLLSVTPLDKRQDINVNNSGSGSVNTNYGGTQNNYQQSGTGNRQYNGNVNYR